MSADNIKVAIRVRPLIARELRSSGLSQWKIQEKTSIFQIDESGQAVSEVFSFDRIFEPDESNQFIYKTLVESFIKSTLSGVNSTVFAYGQTSSGKTYTMLGDENNPGIMTLAVEDIFAAIEASSDRKYLIRVAYLEIYNEKVIDLLGNPNDKVHVREVGGSVHLINLTEEIVSTPEQVFELLRVGTANRQFGETNLNERSSRSHTIFKILLESTDVNDSDSPIQQSTINLVDLAGSERASQTKATGVRLFEGGHINKSLSTLSLVIRQITEGREFVNFRDCKLTQILRNSLGGNAKTLIIANVTIASVENTLSTLLFAQTAKAIKCKPQINEVLSDAALSKRYALLSDNYKRQLEDQLKTNQDLELDKETKTKTIDHLRKVIQNLEYFANHSYDRSDSGAVPKRRHTICILGRNGNQSLLPIREGVAIESFELTNFESTTSTDPGVTRDHISEETFAAVSLDSTPKGVLRQRLHILEEEHLELVRFTRDEKDVRKQEDEKAIRELEKRLNVLQRKFEDETKILEAKIDTLNDQLSIKSSENELVVDQLKTKFKKREEELVTEIDRLKCAEGSRVVQTASSTPLVMELLDDLVNLQDVLIRAASDEALSDERVLQAYARLLEDNAEQIIMLNFVFDNLKLLCERQNMTEITGGDCCYQMHFLLEDDKIDTLNFLHQLCLQYIKIFDVIKCSSDLDFEKLNYAKAELQDALFVLHNKRNILLDTLLPVLTRCNDLLKNYVKINCAPRAIDCWNTVLESFLRDILTERSNVNNLEELSKKLTGIIPEYDEQHTLTFLNKYSVLCSGLKQFEECKECFVKQNNELNMGLEEKNRVIADLTSDLMNLNIELSKEKSRKCENCKGLEDQIETIMKDLKQEKQGCQDCENIDLRIRTALTDLEQDNQALHLHNENLKCKIQTFQSDVDRLNDELNLNTKFNHDMVEEHANISEGLKAQIEELEKNLCECNIAHKEELEVFKLKVDELSRELCSEKEVRNSMAAEHSTVVEGLKLQIEVLEQKLCECNVVHEKETEVFKLKIDDLNRELCSEKNVRNCMVAEHSTIVEDLKLQIEQLEEKLHECVVVHEKETKVFNLKIDDLNRQLCSNEEVKNRITFEHEQVVLDFEAKVEQLMLKLTEHDCDLQAANKKHEEIVNDLKSQVAILQIEIDRMNSNREGLIDDHNEELKRLRREIEEQANDRQNDQVKLKMSKNIILEHKNTIKSLKGQISHLENALQASNEVKDKMIVDHKNAIENLELQVLSLEKNLDSSATLKSKIEILVAKLKEMSSEYTKMVETYETRLSEFQSDVDKQFMMKQDHDRQMAKTSSRLQGLGLELGKAQQLLNVANLRNTELNKQLQALQGEHLENAQLRHEVKELQCNIDFYKKEQLERKEYEKNKKISDTDREFSLKEEQLNKSNGDINLSRRANEASLRTTGIIVTGQGKENSETNCKDCTKYRDHLKEQTKINGALKENFKKEKSKSDSRAMLAEELSQAVEALKKNVEQLNARNLAFAARINELENATAECASCAKWRNETRACQKEMAGLTRKLVDIQVEYYSLKKANTKHQKSDFVQFLEDRNELLQSRNENLSRELKETKARCQALTQALDQAESDRTCSCVETATKEVQCNILDDDEDKYKTLFEKYKLTKQVAIMRKEQIDELTKKMGRSNNV